MKIKVVVRPEDAQKADVAAENARRMRRKRARWGLAALLGLVALSAAVAFFFIAREPESTGPQEQPVASAPPAVGSAAEQALPSEPAAAPPADEGGDTAAADTAARVAPEAGDDAAGEGTPGTVPAVPAREAPAVPPAPADGGMGEGGTLPPPSAQPPASKAAPSAPADGIKAPVVTRIPARPDAGVVRSQLVSRVVGREPVDALQSPVSVGAGGRNVYYFNEFRNLSGQTVTHRWEHNGQVMAAIPFKIEGNRWRVYSSKRIGENQRGAWRVSTVDKAGAVLARADFRVE